MHYCTAWVIVSLNIQLREVGTLWVSMHLLIVGPLRLLFLACFTSLHVYSSVCLPSSVLSSFISPSIWAKGCMLDDCVCAIWLDTTTPPWWREKVVVYYYYYFRYSFLMYFWASVGKNTHVLVPLFLYPKRMEFIFFPLIIVIFLNWVLVN